MEKGCFADEDTELSLFFLWIACDTKAPSDLATDSRMSQPSVGSQGSGSGAKPTSAAGLGDRKSPRRKLLDQTQNCHPRAARMGACQAPHRSTPAKDQKGSFCIDPPTPVGSGQE